MESTHNINEYNNNQLNVNFILILDYFNCFIIYNLK